MFNKFHKKNSTEKLTLIISAAVGLALVLTAITQIPSLLQKRTYVGEIFGKKVNMETFNNTYQQNLVLTRFQYGYMFEDIEPLLDLKEQTWDQLILLKEAEKQKIKVSDQEVIDAIAEYKIFFHKNKFNNLFYKQIIRSSLKSDINTFENAIRASLITEKLRQKIITPITFSEKEIEKEYKKNNTQSQINVVSINANDFKDQIKLTDQEIQNYYQKNLYSFFKEPTVKLEYIRADYPEDAGVQKKVETKFKAKAIYKEYLEPSDFKRLAEKFKFKIYETDYVDVQSLNFPFGMDQSNKGLKMKDSFKLLKEIFAMDLEQITEHIKWEKGYFIFRLKEKRTSHIAPLADVKEKITNILTKQKARELAKKKAEEYHQKIQQQLNSNKKFSEIIKNLKLKSHQTKMLSRRDLLFNLSLQQKDWDILFNLNSNQPLSQPAATTQGYSLLYLEKNKPVNMDEFKSKKQNFVELILKEKKNNTYSDFVAELNKKANLKRFPVK